MNTCKNFVDSIKNADFTGIFRLIMKEPSYLAFWRQLGSEILFTFDPVIVDRIFNILV